LILRVQTQMNQHRTDTGRLSSGVDATADPEKGRRKKQQLQNIPPRLRDMFVAPLGYSLTGADFKAIQWCIFMWRAAKELHSQFHQKLLDDFLRDPKTNDPHSYLARTFYGKQEIAIEERKTVKPYTYGLLFMGSPGGVADDCGDPREMGVRMSKAHMAAFHPKPLWDFLVKECKRQKYVQTPLGFRRYFWHWDPKATEVIATEIQGAEADLMKLVLLSLAQDLDPRWEILTSTHDSYLILHPTEDTARVREYVAAKMEQPIPFFDGQKWLADVKTGQNWRQV
jgi:DNA polymerase I-like protein with 3'-5' exonuclease and polymerase domains